MIDPLALSDSDLETIAVAVALESGVSRWDNVSEEGEYDGRQYWRRLARAAMFALLPDKDLIAAFQRTDGESAEAVNLLTEIQRRNLDL